MYRRRFLPSMLALCAAPALQAQPSYPSRPIQIVVPFAAGGGTDNLARLIAREMQQNLKQPVIVENRPGASGAIGAAAVTRAPADGYTALLTITSLVQLPALQASMPFDPLKDLQPVTQIASGGILLVANKNMPFSSLKELVAAAKSNPGKFSYGSFGAGSTAHIYGAQLAHQAGIDVIHVPYRGTSAIVQDLLGGQVSMGFMDVGSAMPILDSVKVLGVVGTRRLAAVAAVPTFGEQGFPGFDSVGWFGMFLPAGVPPEVLRTFSDEVRRILRLPALVERIEGLGLTAGGQTPEEFAHILRRDAEVFQSAIRRLGIRLE